ncbi:MAG: SusF/SusE family outer membrane protein, partial [Dysgonamonadaceae bacterium]|nr:SusF/SusE family outer membrane protein [Dysgonamonadaceae bacterium]
MKRKLAFLIVFTAVAVCNALAQNLEVCYVVGGATNRAGDWDAGKAVRMHKESDGVFSSTLPLWNNTENRGDGNQFKFINQGGWGDGFNPVGNTTFESGTEYDITFKGADDKFIVATPGWYRIDLDMNTLKVTITAAENYGPAIVAVGNALYGYELGRAPALSKGPDADGFVSTITYLKENEEFKFSHGTEFWENRICPMEDVNPASVDGTEYELNYASADKKFKVATAGWYKLSINPVALTAKFEALTTLPLENLYIAGDATEAGWTAGNAREFKNLGDGSFRWRGYLTEGQFKFIDEKTFNHSICPEDDDITFTNGQEYNLKYDGQWKNTGGWDKKFAVSTDGYYSVTVTVDGLSLKAVIDAISPGYETMYLNAGDSSFPMTLVEEEDNNVFTWTGQLTEGELRFHAAADSWDDAFNPLGDDDVTVTFDTEYDLYWRPLSSAGKDYKFLISEAAKYKVDLNLNTMKVT